MCTSLKVQLPFINVFGKFMHVKYVSCLLFMPILSLWLVLTLKTAAWAGKRITKTVGQNIPSPILTQLRNMTQRTVTVTGAGN